MADRIPLARVAAIQGKAVIKVQGTTPRQLRAGDVICEGDVVVTATGSRVDLATPDGHSLLLHGNETLTVDAETLATVKPGATDAALVAGASDLNRLIRAINDDGRLDALLDEAVTGSTSPGRADAGPTFVRLLRIIEHVDPVAPDFGTR